MTDPLPSLPPLHQMPGSEAIAHLFLEHELSEAARGAGLVDVMEAYEWHGRDHAWRAQDNAPADAVTHRHEAPIANDPPPPMLGGVAALSMSPDTRGSESIRAYRTAALSPSATRGPAELAAPPRTPAGRS
jgi:hypothetical protein